MIADFGFDAEDGARHVAFHARTAGALRRVVSVGGETLSFGGMAASAEGVGVGPELRVAVDVGVVGCDVAIEAGGLAFEEAFTLPEAERIGGEAAGAAIGPVVGVFTFGLREFEDGLEVIEVVIAGDEVVHEDVAQGVALGADHSVADMIELSLQNNVVRGFALVRGIAIKLDVLGCGPVAPFAIDAQG